MIVTLAASRQTACLAGVLEAIIAQTALQIAILAFHWDKHLIVTLVIRSLAKFSLVLSALQGRAGAAPSPYKVLGTAAHMRK